MADYLLSPDAVQDLKDIWDFIRSDSAEAADKVIDALFDAFEGLAVLSHKGHKRKDWTSSDVRFWSVFSFHIIYRPQTKPLHIVGIVHGARDIPEVLKDREPL